MWVVHLLLSECPSSQDYPLPPLLACLYYIQAAYLLLQKILIQNSTSQMGMCHGHLQVRISSLLSAMFNGLGMCVITVE